MANTKASSNANFVQSFTPTGMITKLAHATTPSGWLLCDGAEYSQTTYAALFAALGTTYDTQQNPVTGAAWAAPSGGNFRVPDYRGVFLRGVGTPNGLDAVTLGGFQDQKTKKNGLSITDPTHRHNISNVSGHTGWFMIGGGMNYKGGNNTGSYDTTNTNMNTSTTGITIGNGDNETRAINKGVNYIIKI